MSEAEDTPVTFSHEEMGSIKSLMEQHVRPVPCPRCGDAMWVSDPIDGLRDNARVFQLRCKPCHCTAVMRDDSPSD